MLSDITQYDVTSLCRVIAFLLDQLGGEVVLTRSELESISRSSGSFMVSTSIDGSATLTTIRSDS